MNTQWFLSQNGSVTGPLSLADAEKFVKDNENVYVWQANFTQWQAASQVTEFSKFVKESEVTAVVPQALIEKFSVKKKRVYSKLLTCTDKFSQSEKALEALLAKINDYKTMTANLSPAVQGVISSTEKRYQVLANKVNTLTAVVKNAEEELISVSNDFENKNEVTSQAATTKALKGVEVDNLSAEDVSVDDIEVIDEEVFDIDDSDDSMAQAMKSAEEEFLAKLNTDASAADASDVDLLEQEIAETNDANEVVDEIAELEAITEDVVEEPELESNDEVTAELDTQESSEAEEALSSIDELEQAAITAEKKEANSSMADIKSLFSGTKDAAIFAGKGFKGANKLFKSVFTPLDESSPIPLSKQLNQLPKDDSQKADDAQELSMADSTSDSESKK